MVKSKRKNTKFDNKNKIFFYFKKEFTGVLIYLLILIICAFIAVSLDLEESKTYYLSLFGLAAASFIFAYISVFKERRNGLLYGVLYTLPINCLIVIISLFLCGFKADFHLVISMVILLIFSALGGILSVNRRIRK